MAEELYRWHGYSPVSLPQLKLGRDQDEAEDKPNQNEKGQEQARNPPAN